MCQVPQIFEEVVIVFLSSFFDVIFRSPVTLFFAPGNTIAAVAGSRSRSTGQTPGPCLVLPN